MISLHPITPEQTTRMFQQMKKEYYDTGCHAGFWNNRDQLVLKVDQIQTIRSTDDVVVGYHIPHFMLWILPKFQLESYGTQVVLKIHFEMLLKGADLDVVRVIDDAKGFYEKMGYRSLEPSCNIMHKTLDPNLFSIRGRIDYLHAAETVFLREKAKPKPNELSETDFLDLFQPAMTFKYGPLARTEGGVCTEEEQYQIRFSYNNERVPFLALKPAPLGEVQSLMAAMRQKGFSVHLYLDWCTVSHNGRLYDL